MGETMREPDRSSHGPARGYKWEPFQPGNTAALAHGATSPGCLRPIAERLAAEVVVVVPWCGRPAFSAAVQSWAWTEAQLILLRAWLDANGFVDADGNPRPAVSFLAKLEGRAEKQRGELGISPMSLARLLATLAGLTAGERAASAGAGVDDLVAQLAAEGRAALAAHHQLEEGVDD